MDHSPGVVMWRAQRKPHVLRCVVEQVAEDCLELRVFWGKELLAFESFEEIAPLLKRAEEFRAKFASRVFVPS